MEPRQYDEMAYERRMAQMNGDIAALEACIEILNAEIFLLENLTYTSFGVVLSADWENNRTFSAFSTICRSIANKVVDGDEQVSEAERAASSACDECNELSALLEKRNAYNRYMEEMVDAYTRVITHLSRAVSTQERNLNTLTGLTDSATTWAEQRMQRTPMDLIGPVEVGKFYNQMARDHAETSRGYYNRMYEI